jgi:uncharacterized protein (TIGR02268 family)
LIIPVRLALLLALFLGAAARAEAAPSRTKRERPVAVTASPAEPLPEIHVAPDTLTLLWFPADIQPKTLTVDEARIRVLDTGKRSIIVQAAAGYRPNERQELEVFFADGKAPARAAFVLVMDPAEVDIRIDVERPELPAVGCPPEAPRAEPLPEDFVSRGYVTDRGVQTAVLGATKDDAQGLSSGSGVSYRGNRWVIFDVVISNLTGPLFSPRDATLTGKGGVTLQARRVKAERDAITANRVRVLVVVDEPPADAGVVFSLEVVGDGGRRLVIPRVTLPKPVAKEQP